MLFWSTIFFYYDSDVLHQHARYDFNVESDLSLLSIHYRMIIKYNI